MTGQTLGQDLRIAIVVRHAPGMLRQHLQLNSSSYEGSYPRLREIVTAYLTSVKEWSSSPTPMDVSVIASAPGAGNKCFVCGGIGHMGRQCPSEGGGQSWRRSAVSSSLGKADGRGGKQEGCRVCGSVQRWQRGCPQRVGQKGDKWKSKGKDRQKGDKGKGKGKDKGKGKSKGKFVSGVTRGPSWRRRRLWS